MKKLVQNLIFLLFLLVCNLSYGQNNTEDVVYLKNGSILRGIIIEQVPDQIIKIQLKDRSVFALKYEEIEKIVKENLPGDNSNNNSKVTVFKKRGFINWLEINYSHGIGNVNVQSYTVKNDQFSYGFRTFAGYQFNEHLSLGIGFGIDKYKYTNATRYESTDARLPITFDVRTTIMKGKVSPVFTANMGYAVGLNGVKGGIVINPQIGIKTYISKNVVYIFNIGYKCQEQEETYSFFNPHLYSGNYSYTDYTISQFITISTGFSF